MPQYWDTQPCNAQFLFSVYLLTYSLRMDHKHLPTYSISCATSSDNIGQPGLIVFGPPPFPKHNQMPRNKINKLCLLTHMDRAKVENAHTGWVEASFDSRWMPEIFFMILQPLPCCRLPMAAPTRITFHPFPPSIMPPTPVIPHLPPPCSPCHKKCNF